MAGCASKQTLLVEPLTYHCLNDQVGAYKIEEWCSFSEKYCTLEYRTCDTLKSDFLIADKNKLTPSILGEWSVKHKNTLGISQIVEWFSKGFDANETVYWLNNDIPSDWAFIAGKTNLEVETIHQLIRDNFNTKDVLKFHKLAINKDYWLSLSQEGFSPDQGKRFIDDLDVRNKFELLLALSANTYEKYKSQLIIDNWVCSRSNQIGKLKRISRIDAEVVVRYLIMNKSGTKAASYSLFTKHGLESFNFKSKLERYKGNVSNWAGCPEYVIDRIILESDR
jgi:hypothetical protein